MVPLAALPRRSYREGQDLHHTGQRISAAGGSHQEVPARLASIGFKRC